MPKKQLKQLTRKELEKLLSQQTAVILNSLNHKTKSTESILNNKISKLEIKLDKIELGINKKFDHLISTLDKFLKRVTDLEQEFEIMKEDVNRLKKIVREKLEIDLL